MEIVKNSQQSINSIPNKDSVRGFKASNNFVLRQDSIFGYKWNGSPQKLCLISYRILAGRTFEVDLIIFMEEFDARNNKKEKPVSKKNKPTNWWYQYFINTYIFKHKKKWVQRLKFVWFKDFSIQKLIITFPISFQLNLSFSLPQRFLRLPRAFKTAMLILHT